MLNPAPCWKNTLWISDLNRQLVNIGKTDNHIIIPVGSESDPTYLVCKSESNFSNSNEFFPSVNDPIDDSLSASSLMVGRFNWRSGSGFSLSISKINGMLKTIQEKHANLPYFLLLGKYLEFLEKFNRSYDEDLFLNLFFYVKENQHPINSSG